MNLTEENNLEKEVIKLWKDSEDNGNIFELGRLRVIAHHFAKWQKQQMMKDVTTATCCGAHAFQSVWYFDDLKSNDIAAGDKIKVIIIKEE